MRAYRPSYYSEEPDSDDLGSEDAYKAERIYLYARRAEARLPLFDDSATPALGPKEEKWSRLPPSGTS